MNKEEQDMLESSLKRINDKLQWLGTCALEIRRAIESVNNVLSAEVPILHAVRLTKFKFIDQTGDFDGEDIGLLGPEEHKCWNRILEREVTHMKRVTANRDALLVYKTSLDDVGEDINGLNNRYTEIQKKLCPERHEEEQSSEPVETKSMNQTEKVLLLIIIVLSIVMFFVGGAYVKAGMLSGWLLIVPAAFIIVYSVFTFISDDMNQTNYGYY